MLTIDERVTQRYLWTLKVASKSDVFVVARTASAALASYLKGALPIVPVVLEVTRGAPIAAIDLS